MLQDDSHKYQCFDHRRDQPTLGLITTSLLILASSIRSDNYGPASLRSNAITLGQRELSFRLDSMRRASLRSGKSGHQVRNDEIKKTPIKADVAAKATTRADRIVDSSSSRRSAIGPYFAPVGRAPCRQLFCSSRVQSMRSVFARLAIDCGVLRIRFAICSGVHPFDANLRISESCSAFHR